MKQPIGIIGAMEMEVQAILSAMEEKSEQETAGMVFYSGLLGGVPCVAAQCGPGKVSAAACAQAMILNFSPRLLINVGVAGGIGQGVNIGDLVIASACVQYDMDTSVLGDRLGAVSLRRTGKTEMVVEFPCDSAASRLLAGEAEVIYGHAHSGVVATGDTFVADGEKSRAIGAQFSAKAVEMEGGSIAQVCYMNGVPCAVLRAISDNADDTGKMDYLEFARIAADRSARLLCGAVPKL